MSYFTLSELTRSDSAQQHGINNTPGVFGSQNINNILIPGLNLVRELLGNKPIHISSGYRCYWLNKKIGGSSKSKHMLGLAADFTCPDYGNPEKIVRAVMNSGIEYTQLFNEFNRWVHIAFPAENPATVAGKYYRQNGRKKLEVY